MRVCVTFGQRFAREDHPKLDNAHPDGWYEVDVPDELDIAGRIAYIRSLLGEDWSNVYTKEEFKLSVFYYPRGRLGVLKISEER